MSNQQRELIAHYCSVWGESFSIERWKLGPMHELNNDFCILEFPPYPGRDMWTYATIGMSLSIGKPPIELHIFSAQRDASLVELLTVVAYYHFTGDALDIGHTVNFGKSWQNDSQCTYGVISLPYLDGPELENMNSLSAKFYWLIPITKSERNYKAKFGLEALEELFDASGVDYLNSNRKSLL